MIGPEDVRTFWFEETAPAQWFTKDERFDETVRERFEEVYARARRGETSAWRETPEGRLAEILVLDQFARNMFRGTPGAFAADEDALMRAREAVARGDDLRVPPQERAFFYMPYMHSESREAHEEALSLFTKLGNEEALKYEVLHKEIIDRFGRYPHRNDILGRSTTSEEAEFLKTHEGF